MLTFADVCWHMQVASKWKRELDWLLLPLTQIVVLSPAHQLLANGNRVSIMKQVLREDVQVQLQTYACADVCGRMLCSCTFRASTTLMLTYADVCRRMRMLTYADVCCAAAPPAPPRR